MNIKSFVLFPDSPADPDVKFSIRDEYILFHSGIQEELTVLDINSPSLSSIRYRISSYKEIYKHRYPTDQDLLANTILSICQSLLDKYPYGAQVPSQLTAALKNCGIELNMLTALYLPFNADIWEDAKKIAREEMLSYNR